VPELNAIGVISADLVKSLQFYRLLGLDMPESGEDHVEATMPNGVRFMLDDEQMVKGFRPDWSRETGNQVALAFQCSSPAEVDEIYKRVTDAGFQGEKEPWDAFWGQRYGQLRDPDGTPIDLYAPL
jgi:uncharacterized glyoxalase superfamily protein PhnB